MGLDASQCERHPLCVRGYKHRGRGGHCALAGGGGVNGSSLPPSGAKRARHQRIVELNAGREVPPPPTAERAHGSQSFACMRASR